MAEWEQTPAQLGEVADVFVGFPFRSEIFVTEGVKLLRGDNISQGHIDWTDAQKLAPELAADFADYELCEGDIVLAMDRPWVGAGLKFASIREEDAGALLVQRTARLRGSEAARTEFLRYVIASPAYSKYIKGVTTGSLVPHISKQQIQDFRFFLPSLDDQQKIAAVLSALDAKIDLNHRINAELEALAKTIYDYWFVQFDFPDAHGRPYKSSGGAMVWNDTLKREIPVGGGWAFGTLGEVIQLVYGKPLKESDRSGTGFPVMGSNGVVGYHKEFLAEGPGIVVGRKGTAGAISYSHENFFPIDTTFYVTPRRDYGFNFLLHLLRSLPLTKLNSDSAVPGLNRDSALRLPVLLPPDDLVKRYDMLASTFEAKLKNALFENRELTQLRDWLLPLLMNGQVRVA